MKWLRLLPLLAFAAILSGASPNTTQAPGTLWTTPCSSVGAIIEGNGAGAPAQCGSVAGTAAAANTGTSGATVPFLNGTNVWSGGNNFTSTFQLNGAGLNASGGVISPSPTRNGDIIFWNGSAWAALLGNTSGTQVLQENSSGSPSWATIAGTGTVTSIVFGNGLSGGTITTSGNVNITMALPPTFRITLATGTPVMTSTLSNQLTVFVTPDGGNWMPINTSGTINPVAWSEVSQAVTDATKSPAATVANSVYDVFCWVDSGTNRCTRGPAWTNSTTRGYTFTSVQGILTNTTAITNGPGAQAGTWVGTFKTNASGNVDYILGSAANGGGAAILGVWNEYDRRTTCTVVTDSGASYTYNSATFRQAHASTGNQITFVSGAVEDGIDATMNESSTTVAVSQAATQWCVGLDTTSSCTIQKSVAQTVAAVGITGAGTNEGKLLGQLGVHIISANEASDGSNSNSFNVGTANTLSACVRN